MLNAVASSPVQSLGFAPGALHANRLPQLRRQRVRTGHVDPGAKVFTSPAHHDHADVGPRVEPLHRAWDLGPHVSVDGVGL